MLISSLEIPYSIMDILIKFEDRVYSVECKKEECEDSILFDDGLTQKTISIDILHEELLSNLMLELER